MPEGDTISYAANRIRPVLAGRVPEEIHAARNPDWPERLGSRVVNAVDTHGKHLFVRFEGGLAIHSHLGMTGSWRVYRRGGRTSSRAWLVFRLGGHEVAELGGPTLELLTDGRTRLVVQGLGPDVLADEFDHRGFLKRLRADDATRPLGDALLDQSNVAGIGNIWKAEGCWEAEIDPWRPVGQVPDSEALAVIEAVRPRMLRSASDGLRAIQPRVYKRPVCPRCATRVEARGQGDANRTTYWCPGCQR